MQNSGDQTESEVRALSVRPEDQPDFENFKISDKYAFSKISSNYDN